MWDILTGPIFWGSIGVVFALILVISMIVSLKRKREVAELNKMFPENVIDTSEKISVDKVRRSTRGRRNRGKQEVKKPALIEAPPPSELVTTPSIPDKSSLPQIDRSRSSKNETLSRRSRIETNVELTSADESKMIMPSEVISLEEESSQVETPTRSSTMRSTRSRTETPTRKKTASQFAPRRKRFSK